MATQNLIYQAITRAVEEGRLEEPFTIEECSRLLSGFRRARIGSFVARHCEGNPLGLKVFFQRVERAQYRLARDLSA